MISQRRMRLAVLCKSTANGYYRALLPLKALEQRGHSVTWPGDAAWDRLADGRPPWDLLHLHQSLEDDALETVQRLRSLGVAVVWDSDDDIGSVPKGAPAYKRLGGRRGVKRQFERSVEMARAVNLMTTTTESIAEIYRSRGVEQVAVIGNHVRAGDIGRPRRRHAGVVIGCTAASEHQQDIDRLGIADTLAALLQEHEGLRVVAIGVDLKLRDRRYTHHVRVPITSLIEHERVFDIGIAPLIDSPLNASRSDIKLKEYAAAGAMWLASPRGPYASYGAAEGGQLVPDGDWYAALDGLVRDPARRVQLTKRAQAWVTGQTIERAVQRWENVFREVVAGARGPRHRRQVG